MKGYRLYYLTCLCSLLLTELSAQRNGVLKNNSGAERKYRIFFTENQFLPEYEEYKKQFGRNKEIPQSLELAALVALSKFPELKEASIKFVIADQKEVMYVRPNPAPFFKNRKHRTFTIYVSNNKDIYEALVLSEIPFNALVGVIGHELSHVTDFYNKSGISFFLQNIRYALSKKHRAKIEREADLTTLDHGLGYQLANLREVYDQYLIVLPETTKKQFKSYLTYREIIDYLEKGIEIERN